MLDRKVFKVLEEVSKVPDPIEYKGMKGEMNKVEMFDRKVLEVSKVPEKVTDTKIQSQQCFCVHTRDAVIPVLLDRCEDKTEIQDQCGGGEVLMSRSTTTFNLIFINIDIDEVINSYKAGFQ